MFENLFGKSPKNRNEDFEAAKDLKEESPVLKDDEHANTIIEKAEADPENAPDVGNSLADREEAVKYNEEHGISNAASQAELDQIINAPHSKD